jgi:hypothetical protein
MPDRRWDTDERGVGVGDARGQLPALDSLRALAATPAWVTEGADAHLLPHIRAAVPDGWMIDASRVEDDGRLVVDLRRADPDGEPPALGTIRIAAYGLIGSVAESATAVHEVVIDGGRTFEVVTGMLPDDTPFATHGHTLVLRMHAGLDEHAD